MSAAASWLRSPEFGTYLDLQLSKLTFKEAHAKYHLEVKASWISLF